MNNPIITAYVEANKAYIDADSADALCCIPDAAWPAILEALDEYRGAKDPGIDCDVAKTHETLADFNETRLNRWHERGYKKEHQFAGFTAVHYERFQLKKGEPRQDMMVVDLGEFRIALY